MVAKPAILDISGVPGYSSASSNINEVIRAVLNSLFFFTKRFRTHKKHEKHQKAPKAQKAQKRNQEKTQKRK